MVAIISQENVNLATMVSRTGRHLQRYSKTGCRQVVGCIPYRYKVGKQHCLKIEEKLEVLVISSQKGSKMLFPKGGWESDETILEAASRETLEEAGVRGIVESKLGTWSFKSNSNDTFHEGYMFPLQVQEQLEYWPEKNVRQRKWMSVADARDCCQQWWMKEALDRLVNRLESQQQQQQPENKTYCK